MTPSLRTEAQKLTLEDRIKQVELRLMAREERLWTGASAIRARVKQALQPRRVLKPLAMAGGLVLVAGSAWWVLRRRGRGSRVRVSHSLEQGFGSPWRARVVAAVGVMTVVPWAAVFNLLWPLLPMRFKKQATPGGTAATLSVALPWLARFAAPHQSPNSMRLWVTSAIGLWEGWMHLHQRSAGQHSAAPEPN